MKISIILPTYNRADFYLKRAIDSVLSQTYRNWELVIIDNNSKDDTYNLIHSYEDSNINYLTINNGGNIAKSRNLGIEHSSGDFIAFLDSDDYWFKDKLDVCVKFFNNNREYSGICHGENWVNKDKIITKNYGPRENFTFEKLLSRGNCVSLSAMVISRKEISLVDNFSENNNIITAEDYDLWIKLEKRNIKVGFLNRVLGVYQIHNESESSNIIKNTHAIQYVIKKHLKHNDYILKKSLSNCWSNAGKTFYKNNKKYYSLKAYIKSLQYSVVNIKVYFYILLLLVPFQLINLFNNKR